MYAMRKITMKKRAQSLKKAKANRAKWLGQVAVSKNWCEKTGIQEIGKRKETVFG